MNEDYKADIPIETARRAFDGLSMVPEKRGDSAREDYSSQLSSDYINLSELATTTEKIKTLQEEFARYRTGYKNRYLAYLNAKSRCMSSMITGPANFPVARNQKRFNAERNRWTETEDFRTRALKAIRKKLCPELAPIMSGDDNAVERLTEKIAKAEKNQATMKAVNAAIRKNKKAGKDAQIKAIMAVTDFSVNLASKLTGADWCGRTGFADYQLTNNNANIRRMKQRLEKISRDQSKEDSSVEGENARIEDSPADNRVRLFFPGKPDYDVRSELKKNGFRWSPTIGAWQAYRNYNSIETAKKIAGWGQVAA